MRVLALDPGQTTGWALFEDGTLIDWGQDHPMWDAWPHLIPEVAAVVYERFSLYADRAASQVNSEFEPSQCIGAAKMLAQQQGIPTFAQPATVIHYRPQGAKDTKITPVLDRLVSPHITQVYKERHARDAAAHGFYWHRFGKGKEFVVKAQLAS